MAPEKGERTREMRGGRAILTVGPTPEEKALLGGVELESDNISISEAQRWGLSLLRAAMPMIRKEQARQARYGDRYERRR